MVAATTTQKEASSRRKYRSYSDTVSKEISNANEKGRDPKFKVPPGHKDIRTYKDLFERTKPLRQVLLEAREQKNLSQSDMAKMLNIKSSEFIGMVENGHRRYELNRIPAIAEVLGLDVQKLCRLALFEEAPLLAMSAFGEEVETFTPTESRDKKQATVTMSPEQMDYMVRLYSLPSPLRYTILDLIEKFTVLIKTGPSRLSKVTRPPSVTE